MRHSHFCPWVLGLLTISALASVTSAQEPMPVKKDSGPIQVETRGPMHDAIAQPFGVKPEAGPMAPKEPPPPIAEEPPAQKPDQENVQWIPGYWAWDAQQQEFMWVSGVYRVPPQNRSYIPGYWAQSADGWRWVPGFWSGAKLQENAYTPEPPAPLDANGPALPAPDENSLYVPGTWMWQGDRFVWRPGYWSAAQDGRVWVPPHYLWTPNGYVYVDGYWDYPLENRGIAFAPLRFNEPVWNDPNWSYQPSQALDFGSFFDSAFVNGNGFYFGNYFDPRYGRAGFNPWYNGRGRYDPLFAYHAWKNHRNNPNWLAGVQKNFAARTAGQQVVKGGVIGPLNQIGGNVKLVNPTTAQVAAQRTGVQQIRELAVTRQQFEAGKAHGANPGRTTRLMTPGSSGPITPGASLPKIINEPRNFTPSSNTPKIVNNAAPAAAPRTIITPATASPAKNFTPTPAAKTFTPAQAPRITTPAPAAAPRTITPAPATIRRASAPAPSAPRVVNSAAARVHTPAPARTVAPARAAPVHSAPARRR